MSTLTRQLERHRDMLPVWAEQKEAVQIVVQRSEKELLVRSEKLEHVMAERERIRKSCEHEHSLLETALRAEQDKALSTSSLMKLELDKSLELERETTQVLCEEEVKNKAMRSSLNQTMGQLESLQGEAQEFALEHQDEMIGKMLFSDTSAAGDLLRAAGPQGAATPPRGAGGAQEYMQKQEVDRWLSDIENLSKEKENVANEIQSAKAQLLRLQGDLDRQHGHNLRYEGFAKTVASGGWRYCSDPAMRKEAASLVAAAAKSRNTAAGRGVAEATDAARGVQPALWKIWGPPQDDLFGHRQAAGTA